MKNVTYNIGMDTLPGWYMVMIMIGIMLMSICIATQWDL